MSFWLRGAKMMPNNMLKDEETKTGQRHPIQAALSFLKRERCRRRFESRQRGSVEQPCAAG